MHICLVVMLISGAASAHSGDRVYPFYELTDEMLEKIDIHDGLIDEWYEIGEPSMTMLDFRSFQFDSPELSNLDLRIWLGWHDESNRIFAAFVIIDNNYYNTHNYNGEGYNQSIHLSDSVIFSIDADHSGGKGIRQGGNIISDEELIDIEGRTQSYSVIAETVSGPTLENYIRGGQLGTGGKPTSWKVYPPYGDAGGAAAGEQPTSSVIEMYVTPYDWWGAWDDVNQTEFSQLSANQVIGFAIKIYDQDQDYNNCAPCSANFWFPADLDVDGLADLDGRMQIADIFLDGLLLPAQATAVESITWGRIKASLQQ